MQLHSFLVPMVCGLGVGLATRVLLIQTTYRQFPSKPHGMIIHIFLGFVASLLGALIVPAVFKPDFTAGVFVSIGTAQFHTIRDLERAAWRDLDKGEIVPRGAAYIEGLVVSFEARIFLVFGISAFTTAMAYFFKSPVGLVIGAIVAVVIRFWRQGKRVSDLAKVEVGRVSVENQRLYVSDIEVTTFSEEASIDATELLSVVVRPHDSGAILTLAHQGQQQAILHNLCVSIGTQVHADFHPLVSYFPKDKALILVVLPLFAYEGLAVESVQGAPILEGVLRRPLHSPA